MERQLTDPKATSDPGFTLVELLVVVAILAVLSVGATMLSVGRSGQANSDMTTFRADHVQMRSLAVHGQALRGVYVSPQGQRRATFGGGRWTATGPELAWKGRVRLTVPNTMRNAPGAPDVIYYPGGETTPFSIAFDTGQTRETCTTDGWTELTCRALR